MTNSTHALPDSALIALGHDEKKRPRGAWFAQPNDKLLAALSAMRCQVLSSVPNALQDLARKLPEGRLLSSGKVVLPNIGRGLHEQISAASANENSNDLTATLNERLRPDSDMVASATAKKILSQHWDDVRAGDVVLAPFGPDEGWWEATVVERENSVLTLRYRDYPKEPTFVRHVSTLARIHPDLL
ncbi:MULTISPECIES: hypothetical protein [unclassified Tardiphaga]|uniref:hypothetical protein n=1 Tax=unclassified Tardiphaga TaxID=2631404 RepID=UPI001FED8ACF|nr:MULTISPECIES: hypothetical protein [unclassified Tardiphaga]